MNDFSLSRSVSTLGFNIKKNSPTILIVAGIASMATSIALACVATKKLDKTLAPSKKIIDTVHAHLSDDTGLSNNLYDVKKEKKDLTVAYLKAGGKIILLYSPAAVAFAVGTACIVGSHNIMRGRNIALTALCSSLENSYRSYREKVKEKIGEDAEKAIYESQDKKEITTKDGKKKLVNTAHDFSVLYADGQRGWENDAKLNMRFLLTKQAYLNQVLKVKGYVFLSDVYEELGFDAEYLGEERLRASHLLGWRYDPSDKTIDNYISFGLEDKSGIIKDDVSKQLNENEPDFWLEFNYDGDIVNGLNGHKTFAQGAKY